MDNIRAQYVDLGSIRARVLRDVTRIEWNRAKGSLYESIRAYDVAAARKRQCY